VGVGFSRADVDARTRPDRQKRKAAVFSKHTQQHEQHILMQQRVRSAEIRSRKGTPFATVTAYDVSFCAAIEAAGIDVILVGDSLGNVILGYDSTVHVTLQDMVRHGSAVARATVRSHVIIDMPFMSYEVSDEEAIRNAGILVRAGAQSVKLEGAGHAARISAIVAAGIPVVAHIGVIPQTAALHDGFRKRTNSAELLADARAVTAAGAFAVVLEMVDGNVAAEITRAIPIPTIGIGSGPHCDAQILVLNDLLGLSNHPPPFAHPYVDLKAAATSGLQAYADDVRTGRFGRELLRAH
jgi:3-methyl-2-oxobutanoate hydroxymethyltransferase